MFCIFHLIGATEYDIVNGYNLFICHLISKEKLLTEREINI